MVGESGRHHYFLSILGNDEKNALYFVYGTDMIKGATESVLEPNTFVKKDILKIGFFDSSLTGWC